KLSPHQLQKRSDKTTHRWLSVQRIPGRLLSMYIGMTAACMLLAQGTTYPPGANSWRRFQSPYDPRMAPPISLSEAEVLATQRIGLATNRFYCISASCLEPTKRGL